MSTTLAQTGALSLAYREEQVEEIQRRAQRWRLMDCTEPTLRRMRAALDARMAVLEQRIEEADEEFRQYVEVGNPSGTDQTLETINRLSGEWENLRRRIREVDNVLQELYLRSRLIDFLRSERNLNIWEGIVLVSILIVVGLTLAELLIPGLPLIVLEVIIAVDTTICIFLLGDFFLRLALAQDKRWYVRNYWIDFLSSIPFYAILRFGRLVRLARFVRLIRLLRLTRAVRLLLFAFRGLDKLLKTFEVNLLKRSMLVAAALLVFGALAISAVEGQREQAIQDFGESLWWSFATVVTGGFADLYNPTTATGRIVTVGMILLGLTVTGIFTASLTSVFVEDESSKLKHNQNRFEERLEVVDHKLDLLTGETNHALIALEATAQAVSKLPKKQLLADLLVHSLTADFHSLQASVHLLDESGQGLVRLAHQGLEEIAPPERIPLSQGFLGGAAAELRRQDLTDVDLEPETQVYAEVQGMAMVCPMAAAGELIGLVHTVLPHSLASDYLYTRIPMTLAHQAGLAFYSEGQGEVVA